VQGFKAFLVLNEVARRKHENNPRAPFATSGEPA
jgi:hypothetical protein